MPRSRLLFLYSPLAAIYVIPMRVDHIIIFSNNQGSEADELVSFGLIEGSNRIHQGQGTRNRKFFFENFFLEIVWVNNECEITNELTSPTRLWERSNYKTTGSSPFGLCLQNTEDINTLFEGCLKYQPTYLPEDMSFEIITNEENSHLPWTCRLPSISDKNKISEPINHPVGIRNLTNIKFGIRDIDYQDRFVEFLSTNSKIVFENYEDHHLTLEFDSKKFGSIKKFGSMQLTIEY